MKKLECYTDGAYSPMRNAGGIGIVFLINGEKVYEYNKKIENTTNNKCELLAVIYTLHAINKKLESVTIYTDSQYVIGCATKGWKRKANTDLWKRFDEELLRVKELCNEVNFEWVKGHENSEFNKLADKLAVEASQLV